MPIPEIIISLTSRPDRMDYVDKAIGPLLRQSVPADRIMLWLAPPEFEEVGVAIPDKLREYELDPRFSIEECPVNLKPHNKYYHVMKACPEAIVITVDDDIVYPLNLVAELLETHYRHPGAVIAARAHRVLKDDSNAILPYERWTFSQNDTYDQEEFSLFPTGVGGVLYPPNIFDEAVFDKESIIDVSHTQDDLWLFIHEQRLDIPVVNTKTPCDLYYVEGSQDTGLFHQNLEAGNNDVLLKGLFDYCPGVEKTVAEHAWLSPEFASDSNDGRTLLRKVRDRLVNK